MSLRIVKLELEAKLAGQSGGLFSKTSGKIERKSYEDGGERLKITLRNLKAPEQSIAAIKAPEQSIAAIKADGVEIAEIALSKGAGRFDEESFTEGTIPYLTTGQTIEVFVNGELILSGDICQD